MLRKSLFNNDKKKLKMKKNANVLVDHKMEKKLDPKFKTELCKSWSQTKFCVYGNSCRFAHGKKELSSKAVNHQKYKQKDCKYFKEMGVCMYGSKCNFKHDDRELNLIERSYYSFSLQFYEPRSKRLNVFEGLFRETDQMYPKIVNKPSTYKTKINLNENLFFDLSRKFPNESKNEISHLEKIRNCEKYVLASNYLVNRPNFLNLQSLMMRLY